MRTAAGTRLVQVEAQTRYDPNMLQRMLDYGLLGWLSYDRQYPLGSYVLLFTEDRLPHLLPPSLSLTTGSL